MPLATEAGAGLVAGLLLPLWLLAVGALAYAVSQARETLAKYSGERRPAMVSWRRQLIPVFACF